MSNSIHPFPSDESYFLSLAQTKKDICVKMVAVSASIFLFLSVTIPVVHLFLPRSAFFYGYTGVGLLGGLLVITALSLKSYFQWKKCRAQAPSYELITVLGCKGFRKEEIKKPPSEGSEKKAIVPTEVVKPETQLIEGNFIALPVDVLFSIMKKLKLKDLCRMAQTCKAIDLLLKQDDFWRGLISSDFGVEFVPRDHFKKEYRFLYSIRNNIYNKYSKISSVRFYPFFFDHKLHLKDLRTISDGNVTLIGGDAQEKDFIRYSAIENTHIISKKDFELNFENPKVYDNAYKYIGDLDVTVRKSDPSTLLGPQLIVLNHINTVYLFDKKTLAPLHHMEFDSQVTNVFCRSNECYVTLKNGDIFVYRKDCRSPERCESKKRENAYGKQVMEVGGEIFFVFRSQDLSQIFLYSSKDLLDPYLTLATDKNTTTSKYEKYICLTNKKEVQIWDILKKSAIKTIPLKAENYLHVECQIYKNFLFLSTLSEGIQIINFVNNEEIHFREKSVRSVIDLELWESKLVVTSTYNRNQYQYEVIDFGKFIS